MDTKVCATTDETARWENIDFQKAGKCVKKQQGRIAAAYAARRYDVALYLQHQLTNSFYARCLAVRCIANSKGCNTPGVDGELIDSPDKKNQMVQELSRRGYKPRPLKRILIPKSDGSSRPLCIPTMRDRGMQTLYKFALEPISELTADDCSFGFRPGRSARMAIRRLGLILRESNRFQWLMKADIKSCFDTICHDWLLENIPMDKKILRKFLKAGYVDEGVYHSVDAGTPQGGCISPMLCNMTLDGMEAMLKDLCGDSVRLVRYADDIVMVGVSKSGLVQIAAPAVEKFLSERGLHLSPTKTYVSSVDQGITFLGWNIYKSKGKVFAVPSQQSMKSLENRIIDTIQRFSQSSNWNLCVKMKNMIGGWVNYYKWIPPFETPTAISQKDVETIFSLTGDKLFAEKMGCLLSPRFYLDERRTLK